MPENMTPVIAKSALLQALLTGPAYGLELTERVRTWTGGVLILLHGSTYPALKRLEEDGFVESFEGPDREQLKQDTGGRAKVYYILTEEGVELALRQQRIFVGLGLHSGSSPIRTRSKKEIRAEHYARVTEEFAESLLEEGSSVEQFRRKRREKREAAKIAKAAQPQDPAAA